MMFFLTSKKSALLAAASFLLTFLPLSADSTPVDYAPVVQVSVDNNTSDIQTIVGTTLTVKGTATDQNGNMTEHRLEIQNPAGSWSWEGWLLQEPWSSSLNGNGSASTKTGSFTFSTAGTYTLRATAKDLHGNQSTSNLIKVTVNAVVTLPPVVTPPTTTPTAPVDYAPVVQVSVNNSTSDIQTTVGTALSVSGTATDANGNMTEHRLEIQNPAGSWSWEGWLLQEPWGSSLSGNGYSSTKTGSFTFSTAGTYTLRATAKDLHGNQSTSSLVRVTVNAVVVTPPPVVVTPPPTTPVDYPPVVQVSVNNSTSDIQTTVGTAFNVSGTATDQNGNMTEHRLEIQNPAGSWSWEGWLLQEPWGSSLNGNGSSSSKTGSFTFSTAGTYTLRATAKDLHGNQSTSNLIKVTVNAVVTPPPVVVTPPPVESPMSQLTLKDIFRTNGTIDPASYAAYYDVWNSSIVSQLLGPTFEALNPGAVDDRPTNFKPVSRETDFTYANRSNPYEVGPPGGPIADGDYWSESGQVAYVPEAANDPGLDRVQVFSYYNNIFAISPRFDWASNTAHIDPQTTEPYYIQMLGFAPREPIAMVRNYATLQNEALVIYRDGLLAVAGTQTSRGWWERPYPGLVFPANKLPTAIAVTTSNEFALVTVWDTQLQRGQLAVVALEGKYIAFQTWPYMGLSNQGSWSDMKLLGYIDLPMAAPSSVAAASNGFWNGPSQTAGLVLSQIDLGDAGMRGLLTSTEPEWAGIVADRGYAIVASKLENKAVVVDLTPLFTYVRNSYLSSTTSYQQTMANRGPGAAQWPQTFATNPAIKPVVVFEKSLSKPTAVLAGQRLDRWSPDRFKAYVACEDGTIHIFDTSSLMARWYWEKNDPLSEIGTFQVGRNPVSMAFVRHPQAPLPLLPNTNNGQPANPDVLNNNFYVACRGDRSIDTVITYQGQGTVYRRIRDSRMGDPVGVSVAGRGNIVTVTDFNGRKILSFRIGAIVDRYGRYYGAGANGTSEFEFAGELPIAGTPFLVNSANVN